MFGACNYMVGSFGLWRSIRVYNWCMELYGRQFCLWRSTRLYFGAWNYVVGSFRLWRSIRVYNWCMELYGRQFWSMEVNPGVCLVDGIIW